MHTRHRTRNLQPLRLNAGFTLIELVMVIVILSVLASVAIPKFIDLGSDAKAAALSGVAGSLSSASAVNYASRKAKATNGNAVANCTDVATSMQGNTLPTGYTITAAAVAVDTTVNCTLTQTSTSNTTTFQAIGIL
ncbi:prepilin-type N-terminal cleavage/methylation domain-containing protein [Ideonella azotifigens]|uniref:Type II secretion system protein n=1 Tax=Ideonella azotifigens TaxID=513160 RepID=A0ABN1KD56_9BURK|nr:prepilin-type N-terminal cleavage/methylation domain-containing protein [Ideonella azotifigens]MCD2343109.1 prepilin-type N-terminal cleavage/methylation domain-containing protein [Ideonella azotifigens]